MKLYRLKNKTNGKYLAACCKYRKPQWTATGVFFRKIDTIKKHAEHICHDWKLDFDDRHRMLACATAHHPERMDNMMVVVNDVTINGEEEIEANEIFREGKREWLKNKEKTL